MHETFNTGDSEGKAGSLSKRDFLKRSLYGICGIAASAYSLPIYSNEINESPMMFKDDLKELLKHAREASYYTSSSDKYVQCNLCPNACYLAENGRSTCRNKFNVDGKLYTIAYGNPCILNTDPIEKKPLFHFYPEMDIYSLATAGCNLRCLNCQNWTISQIGPEETNNYDLLPADVITTCTSAGIKAIAFTYSEPTAYYEYMLETAKLASANDIRTVIVSNGYINETPLTELCKYIDGAAINLKSYKDSIYQSLNSGSLQPVLDTLKTYKDSGVWLEIINLVIPTWTDDLDMIKEMCDWLATNDFTDVPLHFSRFTPMYKLTNVVSTPVATLEKAMAIATAAGLKYVYIGNVAGHIGENTYCPVCAKKIISRKGFVVLEKHIKNGNCEYCNAEIAGIWE
jgi:pyruvate formate lyase activating enzyme